MISHITVTTLTHIKDKKKVLRVKTNTTNRMIQITSFYDFFYIPTRKFNNESFSRIFLAHPLTGYILTSFLFIRINIEQSDFRIYCF